MRADVGSKGRNDMTASSYTVFNAMVDIIASPNKAFEEIRQHTAWLWWPLLVSILLTAAMFAYYYNWVDFQWVVDETIRRLPAEDRAEREGVIRQFMQPGRTMWITVIGVVVISPVVYTIQAAYLHLANKLVTGADIRFGSWFSFTAWAYFVSVFGALAGFVTMLMTDNNQLMQEALAALSMNALLVHASYDEPWFNWANSLTLVNLWTIVLIAIGFARWTGAGVLQSAIVAALPFVLIFGIWALVI
jgi:hypothetical protein